MFKSKSKPRVSKTFRMIIERSHETYRLPRNVEKRLRLGPRFAAMKRGFN